jgi:3-deoxy-manno-octulosonate cytidylyltransferase (CMP-KDO synthetase)
MIPFMRKQGGEAEWHEAYGFFKHIGIYGYSAEAMEAIRNMDLGALEQAESLEQLRWMENGIPIFVAETTQEGHSVDVPEDLDKLPIR